MQNTHCNYDAASPIDEIELGQSIKQLDDEDLFPHNSGKTIRLPSHGLSETWNHKGIVCGFWMGRASVER